MEGLYTFVLEKRTVFYMQTLKDDMRKRFLSVSKRLFLKEGFRETTTRDIAREVRSNRMEKYDADLPVVGILLMLYGGKTARIINAALACFIALFTLLHMSELFDAFNPVQLLIMPMMFVLALRMAFDSVKVCKEK